MFVPLVNPNVQSFLGSVESVFGLMSWASLATLGWTNADHVSSVTNRLDHQSMSVSAFNNRSARTPDHSARFTLRQAIPQDTDKLAGYLARDPWTNLFVQLRVENHLRNPGRNADVRVLVAESLRAPRAHSGGLSLCGLCLVSHQLVMPVTSRDEVALAFGEHLRHRGADLAHVVGERRAASVLWRSYGLGRSARLNRAQRYYVLDGDTLLPSATAPLFKARLDDLESVTIASSAMHLEETYVDPLLAAPETFRLTVRQRILDGRAFVWLDEARRVIFKADISCIGRQGVLLSGVYTRPDMRRRGIARQAMSYLCKRLLRVFSSIMLYVNEGNTPAIRLYDALGFRYHCPYRTVFIARD